MQQAESRVGSYAVPSSPPPTTRPTDREYFPSIELIEACSFPFADVANDLFNELLEDPAEPRSPQRPPLPRLFPEIWTRIISLASWDLASLLCTTPINREIRASCFKTVRDKCDFVLSRSGGSVDRALIAVVEARCGWPDAVEGVERLVQAGGRLGDEQRRKALKLAVKAGDFGMVAALTTAGSKNPHGVSWNVVVNASADPAAAVEMGRLLGLPMGPFKRDGIVLGSEMADLWGAITRCLRRGGDYVGLASALVGENVSAAVSRRVWAEVDLRDEELVRLVLRAGVRATSPVIWRYLSKVRLESLPERAADDALLVELLAAGEFEPWASNATDAITVRRAMERPGLMADLVKARCLVGNYLDWAIDRVVTDVRWGSELSAPAAADALVLVDEILAAGGEVSDSCVMAVVRSKAPDSFVSALIDRMPEGVRNSSMMADILRTALSRGRRL